MMIPAHLHNLTDAEFVSQFDNTDDPVLKEALRRIQSASDMVAEELIDLREEVKRLEEELTAAENEASSAWDEVSLLEARIEELED